MTHWLFKIARKLCSTNPIFEFQDSNQERTIHSNWSKGNVYRFLLEGSGDIFREYTKEYPDASYINEKKQRILRYFNKIQEQKQSFKKAPISIIKRMTEEYGLSPLDTGIHPEDSYEYSYKHNKDKFETLKSQWKQQPTNTKEQELAQQLNLALLDKDFDTVTVILSKL